MAILLAMVSGFATGIFIQSVFIFSWPATVFTVLLALISAGAALLVSRTAYMLITLALVSAVLGGVRLYFHDTPIPPAFAEGVRQRVKYEGVVVADPDIREFNTRITVEVTRDGQETRIIAVVPKSIPNLVRGDRVSVYGTLLVPMPFETDGGRVFRYDKYLAARGIRFELKYGSLALVKHAPWYSVPAALSRAKHAYLSGLARAFPAPYSSLAGGVVIGGKTGLDSDLQEDFIRSGLVQVIVLSGYNVMVVAEWTIVVVAIMAAWALRMRPGAPLNRSRAPILAGLVLLLFVGVAGFTATSVRAAVMALIALYARATGKSYAASRALFVAVFLMLLWNPYYLVFDPGFGLSVVATAGLIWLAPLIEVRLSRLKNAFLKNALATTLAAQIAVLPLLLYETGSLSLIAVVANILVMPVVPLAMGTAALAGVVGAVAGTALPTLTFIIGLPAFLLSSYIIFIARESAALPGAAFLLPSFPFVCVLLAYAGLVGVAAWKRSSTTSQERLAKNASI